MEAPLKPGRQFPGVGTGAVIIEDGCVLLLERQGSHGANTWAIPGGWLDKGETPHEGAEREVLEEVGLHVEAYHDLFWTNELFEEDGIHSLTLLVACHRLDLNEQPLIMEPNKCSDLRWVPVDEVETYDLFLPLQEAWQRIWFEMYELDKSSRWLRTVKGLSLGL